MYKKVGELKDRLYHVRFSSDGIRDSAKAAVLTGSVAAGANVLASKAIQGAYAISDKVQQICDPQNQYSYLVGIYNKMVNQIVSQNNGATIDNIRDYFGSYGSGYQAMISIKNCLESNGVNPDSIVQMNPVLAKVAAIPEFGPIAAGVTAVGIVTSILLSKLYQNTKRTR